MKRNVISLFKFCSLAIVTVFLTVLIFRYVRSPRNNILLASPKVQALLQNQDAEKIEDEKPGLEETIGSTNQQVEDDKIDWHDYKKISDDLKRKGTGEHGIAAYLPASMQLKKEQLYAVNGFNAALSDLISLNRSVPDIRHPACKTKRYLRQLESVSVIVSFHNEHFSTLLRTCYSVINRSPESLLTEIILVDDASTKEELKQQLDDYVAKNLAKVKIIRLAKRSGLIRGRLAGARLAKAKILVFLDSHSEANVNWLPPLLEPIVKDYKTCVCPFIDVIKFETFEYRAQDEGARGAFDWELYYKRLPLLPEDLLHPSEPFKSPVMAGGLFAISAQFFWELGGYDTGLDIWGGEQYELSFKIWQCGGQMVDAPCSRVGHIYRKFPPFPNPGRGDFLGKNYKRVAEVWMDEYAEYIYLRRPYYRNIDPGDLTEQKAIREKLECKPFKWFIENVAFDLIKVYPPIEPEDYASGEIRNIGVPELCLDAKKKKKDQQVVADRCVKDDNTRFVSGEQEFRLTWHKDLRPKGRSDCLDVSRGDDKAPVTIYPCHGNQGNQLWRYDVEKQWLMHGLAPRCLDLDPASKSVFLVVCDPYSETQKWAIQKINVKAINNWQSLEPKVK